MKTVVHVHRETTLYGRDVVEKWTIRRAEEAGCLEAKVDVRPGPGGGSKPLYKEKDVPIPDVPDEVLRDAQHELEHALDSVKATDE